MKIFILEKKHEWEEYENFGVYSTKENAEKALIPLYEKECQTFKRCFDREIKKEESRFFISEYELDSGKSI